MSSPQKRRPYTAPQRLSDPSLPLQIALSYLIVRVYPLNANREVTRVYSDSFVTSILALISSEVFEISDTPVGYEQLRKNVDELLGPETQRILKINDKLQSRGQDVTEERVFAAQEQSWMADFAVNFESVPDGAAFLDNLEKELRERINEDEEEEITEYPEPIERRSPLGIFIRGVLLALRKMSFTETANISRQIGRWCGVQPGPSTFPGSRKNAMNDTLSTRLDTMDSMTGAIDSGDFAGSIHSMRRFYDYQFPNGGRGKHQHALLNLASFHLNTGGLQAARGAVTEAIRVARAEGDKLCLAQCISLLHRIEGQLGVSTIDDKIALDQGQHPPTSSTPMDELWALNTALETGEPVHIAFQRVHQSLGRSQYNRIKQDDKQMQGWTTDHPFDEGVWHASQAGLWAMIGSQTLTELHQDLALESTLAQGDARLTVLLARAERLAMKGKYADALSLLLDFDQLEGLDISSYQRWAGTIWSILHRQAELADNHEALALILRLEAPNEIYKKGGGQGPGVQQRLRDSLHKVTKMRSLPPHLTLPDVAAAMHLSADLGLWPIYRLSVVIFAEILLHSEEEGMSRKAIEHVEKIWPELVTSGHEEVIARAALVLGKAMVDISLDEDQPDLLDHAVQHLERALKSAKQVSAIKIIESTKTLLGLIAELRDEPVGASEEQEPVNLCEKIRQVGEIVKLVGVRVSENWQ